MGRKLHPLHGLYKLLPNGGDRVRQAFRGASEIYMSGMKMINTKCIISEVFEIYISGKYDQNEVSHQFWDFIEIYLTEKCILYG